MKRRRTPRKQAAFAAKRRLQQFEIEDNLFIVRVSCASEHDQSYIERQTNGQVTDSEDSPTHSVTTVPRKRTRDMRYVPDQRSSEDNEEN